MERLTGKIRGAFSRMQAISEIKEKKKRVYCIVLYCVVLYCIVFYRTVLNRYVREGGEHS